VAKKTTFPTLPLNNEYSVSEGTQAGIKIIDNTRVVPWMASCFGYAVQRNETRLVSQENRDK